MFLAQNNTVYKTIACVFLSLTCHQLASAKDVEIDSDTQNNVDEIIATARSKPTKQINLPLVVSTISAEEINEFSIDGVLDDVSRIVPDLFFVDVNKNQSYLAIRGAVSLEDSPGTDQAVGFYRDGQYLGRVSDFQYQLFDVERIEVLFGPQSTRYGRNSLGGTVNIESIKPTEDFNAYLNLKLASFGEKQAGFAVSGPLNENGLRARISGQYTNSDGTTKNLITNNNQLAKDEFGIRLSLQQEAGKYGIYDLKAGISKDMGSGVPRHFFGDAALFPDITNSKRETSQEVDGENDRSFNYVLLTGNDISLSEKTSSYFNFGYRENDSKVLDNEFAPGPAPLLIRADETVNYDKSFSLRGGLLFDVGFADLDIGIYSEQTESIRSEDFGIQAPIGSFAANIFGTEELRNFVYQKIDSNSSALYANAVFNISDDISFESGGRYTWDKKSGNTAVTGDQGSFLLASEPYDVALSQTWNDFSPEFAMNWRPPALNHGLLRSNLFARYASGYKSGGFSSAATNPDSAVVPFDKEKVKSWELGLNADFGKSVKLGVSIYNNDYTDLQTFSIGTNNQGNLIQVVNNAGKAYSTGFRGNLKADILSNLQVEGTYAYQNAKYKTYIVEDPRLGTLDYSGNRLPISPKHSFNFRILGERKLSEEYSFVWTGNYYYQSEVNFFPDAAVGLLTRDETDWNILDLSLGLNRQDTKLRFFVKNMLQNQPVTFVNDAASSFYLTAPEIFSGEKINYGSVYEPRSFGVSITQTW